jgi:hypothetical protein
VNYGEFSREKFQRADLRLGESCARAMVECAAIPFVAVASQEEFARHVCGHLSQY